MDKLSIEERSNWQIKTLTSRQLGELTYGQTKRFSERRTGIKKSVQCCTKIVDICINGVKTVKDEVKSQTLFAYNSLSLPWPWQKRGLTTECSSNHRNSPTKDNTVVIYRDEDPVLAKNQIRDFVPQTKGDF